MKKYTILLFLFVSIATYSQLNKNGIPFITNYTPEAYQASEQNWAVVQDHRGVMYFGNNDDGILEYDGVSWRKIPIANGSIVRSLTVDNYGVVHVGCVNDFGKLVISKNGNLTYKSLKYLIDSSYHSFSDIWNVHYLDSAIYFCCEEYVFKYAHGKIRVIELPHGTVLSFKTDEGIFIPSYNEGLVKIQDSSAVIVPNSDFFKGNGVYTINKFNSKLLVGAYPSGLCWYDHAKTSFSPAFQKHPINAFINTNQLYQSTKYDINKLFLGTIQNGLIAIDSLGIIQSHYNKETGLQDQTIIDIYVDKEKNIWSALNKGIAKIEENQPIKVFNENQGIEGYITDICTFDNKLVISTSLGVYYISTHVNQTPKFVKIEGINSQTLSLLHLPNKNIILVGTIDGLYSIDKNMEATYIDPQIREHSDKNKTTYIQKLYQSKSNPNTIYVALFDGVFTIHPSKNQWIRGMKYPVRGFDIRHIVEDTSGNIWFASYMNGLIQSVNADTSQMKYYGLEKGLPSLNESYINLIDNTVTVGCKTGLWKYSDASDSFIKDSNFSDFNSSVYYYNQDIHGDVWISAIKDQRRWIDKYKKANKNGYTKASSLLKRLPNQLYDVIYNDYLTDITYLGSSSGLYTIYKDSNLLNPQTNTTCLIRKVLSSQDSVIFNGTFVKTIANQQVPSTKQNSKKVITLNYNSNDLKFDFALPFFIQEDKIMYSYLLEGYKNDWSPWSNDTRATFTNIREGNYIFKVKAKNIYGIESSIANYEFNIDPPWYRTVLAYFIYIVIGIILVYIIVKVYTRRLEQEKIRLEGIVRERTAEIREQKEEIEQQAEDLKAANIVLKDQKEEIEKQKEEITASIKYAQRIQKAIVPSEEIAACLLKDYFLLWRPRDIVSGDFWWLSEKDNQIIVAAADCTGHGVPGAFMSMLGVSFLNEIVNQQEHTESHKILNHLRHKVKTTLGQTGKDGEAKDGMDIALLVIDLKKQQLQFSGAYNPLLLIRNGEIITYKADRNPIGIYIKEKESFTQNIVELQKGDTLYIFSDGYVDQFGGPDKMKFTSKRFKELLLTMQDTSMLDQKSILNENINKWMGNTEQIDDIIVLGIRI